MTQKYKSSPIISALAGYQQFFPRQASPLEKVGNINTRQATTESIKLYSSNKQDVSGFYIGNHIIYKYYEPTGDLTEDEAFQMRLAFASSFNDDGKKLLQNVIQRAGYDSSGKAFKIAVDKVPAAEEQGRAVGGRAAGTAVGKGGAQPVDIRSGFGNFEVTTSRLDKVGHHGIYGQEGLKLQEKIKQVRLRFEGNKKNDKKMYQEIANEGFNYFKTRMGTWNKALMKMQDKKRYTSALKVRKDLANIVKGGGGISIGTAMGDGLNRALGFTTGFFNKGAAELTLHALGNMREYSPRQGVSYSFAIDEFKHAILQQFVLGGGKGKPYQWKTSRLKKELTEVITGFAATDAKFALSGKFGSDIDVATRRAHAQTAYRANRTNVSTKTNTVITGNAGALTTNSGRLYPSIDMIHADRELARNIKKILIPRIKKQAKKANKQFSSEFLGPSKPFNFSDKTGWAAPYVAFTDYAFEAFGK